MKPDFALSLSFEGIKFICRVQDGWHQLGDVPLDDSNLETALADMRQKGEDFAGGEALCKIILPNDQIKYLTVDRTEIASDQAALAALEGATPYDINDLAFDFVETDTQIQIAAVARDTLAEAEAFAAEHGFQAVCLVGVPESEAFNGEPFFALTQAAGDYIANTDALAPDDVAVVITSSGDLPTPEPEADPEPAPSFATTRSVESEPAEAPEAAAEVPEEADSDDKDVAAPLLPGLDTPETKDIPPIPAPVVGVTDEGIAEAAAPAAPAAHQQETRFDPATLIAGLKPRAEDTEDARQPAASRMKPITLNAPKKAKKPEAKKTDKTKPAAEEAVIGGKPKYLGLILISVLLLFLAGVAIWASLQGPEGRAGLFSPREEVPQIALLPEVTAEGTITDSAEIEAMDGNEGVLFDPVLDAAIPQRNAEAFYAATGIWDRAPTQPNAPNIENAEDIYLASSEVTQATHDAIALPDPSSYGIDFTIKQQNNPVAAGTQIELDERGLVVATTRGSISPEGIMVFLGKPATLPEAWPTREVEPEVQIASVDPELGKIRPKRRPTDLIEQNQRATLGGSTLSELAKFRPKVRPDTLVKLASVDSAAIEDATNEAIKQATESATEQAVFASLRPKARPKNFARTVARAQEQQASAPLPDSQKVVPSIPTTASVARNATQENAISLRKINLIGVYGSSSNRRALVRLSSGRYKKVKVGDRIDGGKVAAISTSELRYVKGSRSLVLKMPKG